MAGPPLSRDHVVYSALEPQLWRKRVKVCKKLLRTGSGLGPLITKPVAPVGLRVPRFRKRVYDMFARGGPAQMWDARYNGRGDRISECMNRAR